jgi:hypothetical protein
LLIKFNKINWQFITSDAMIDNTIEKFNKNLSKCMNVFETSVNFFCDRYEENYRKNVIQALKAEVQNINNQTRNTNSVNSINSDDVEMNPSHNYNFI